MVRPVFVSPRMMGQLIDEGPRYLGSSDGWYWIGTLPRNVDEILRRELQHERHDAEVGVQRAHGIVRLLVAQGLELEDLELLLLRRRAYGVGFRPGFLRRAEHARHFVSAREKRFQHRFTEVLLTDDRYFHKA